MCVLTAVDTLARTATVEAVKADIETLGLVDIVETEGTVLTINRVRGLRRGDVGRRHVRARSHVSGELPDDRCSRSREPSDAFCCEELQVCTRKCFSCSRVCLSGVALVGCGTFQLSL